METTTKNLAVAQKFLREQFELDVLESEVIDGMYEYNRRQNSENFAELVIERKLNVYADTRRVYSEYYIKSVRNPQLKVWVFRTERIKSKKMAWLEIATQFGEFQYDTENDYSAELAANDENYHSWDIIQYLKEYVVIEACGLLVRMQTVN